VSTADAMFASILEIIDLDAPDLPNNDRDIYEAVLEWMLAEPVGSEVEAPEFAAPVVAASAETVEPVNEEHTPAATTGGQLTLDQPGVVRGPKPSATSEAAKEVLAEPAFGAALTLDMPPPPTEGVDSTRAGARESSSL
jgi:hypothetical protein